MAFNLVQNALGNFAAGCSEQTFFGLLPWYHYLLDKSTVVNGVCKINFDVLPTSGRSDVLLVLLVVIDDLLRIAGVVAIGFVIFGGVSYIMSQGSPDQIQKAHTTIQNALIGLAFCILSVALVGFIGTKIGG